MIKYSIQKKVVHWSLRKFVLQFLESVFLQDRWQFASTTIVQMHYNFRCIQLPVSTRSLGESRDY